MTEQQKRGLSVVSVVIVALVTGYLCWLSGAVMGSQSHLGDVQPGRTFMLTIHNWSGLSILLKSIPALIVLGITIFARYKLKDWQFFAIVFLSFMGIVSCVYLYNELSSILTARKFWAYSPVPPALETYEEFVTKAHGGLTAVGAWLVSLLLIQLGVKLLTDGGAT